MASTVRVLIAHHDRMWYATIEEILRDACEELGIEIILARAKSQNDATLRVKEARTKGKPYDLVVTHEATPAEGNQPPALGGRAAPGLAMIQRLREQHEDVPVLLICATVEELFDAASQTQRMALVREGELLQEQLIRGAKKFLDLDTQREPSVDQKILLDIELDLERKEYRWKLVRGSIPARSGVALHLDPDELQRLLDESEEIQVGSKKPWEKQLHRIGERIAKEIFSHDSELLAELPLGEAGALENTTIRFGVKERAYPLALEALVRRSDEEFWMLRAPIYRYLRRDRGGTGVVAAAEACALFQGALTGPLNCLIIQADAWGELEKGIKLERLENTKLEAEWLRDHLEGNKSQYCIGHVDLIDKGRSGSFYNTVRNVLQQREWHIVHYAGHSRYDDTSREPEGYLVFPENGKAPIKVSMSEFASWLWTNRTQLVYLSSCHSSRTECVFRLAEQGVPAVVGFRWDVEDIPALEFCHRFYEHLFKERSLEYAFLEAKKSIHNERDYKHNPIWASPMLVMQAHD